MLVSVLSAEKLTQEQSGNASIPGFKANLEKTQDPIVRPVYITGESADGNPYIYATLVEKGQSAEQFIYVGFRSIYLKDKTTVVKLIFEGQIRMHSKLFQRRDTATFEEAAKFILLSAQ